jgi:lysophospholipase L1-like esterase
VKRAALVSLAAGVAALAALVGTVIWWHASKADRALSVRLQARAVMAAGPGRDCQHAPGRQVVLLVLGQSNAGNHGAETGPEPRGAGPMVTVFDGSECRRSADPLPGGTGRHRSIWTRLEPMLRQRGVQADLLVAMLAVDSTTIDDWTRDGSPLRDELARLLQGLARASLTPDAVLWQQGESDVRQGTSSQDYEKRLERLLTQLRQAGVVAPVILARSTRCRNLPGDPVTQAQDRIASRHANVRIGPNTDALDGWHRHLDCHFSALGLEMAAQMWADSLAELLERR